MRPQAYVYPAEMRAPRDFLRRRCQWVRKRAELLAPIPNTTSPYHLPELGKKLASKAQREGVEEHFPDPSVRKTRALAVSLIDPSDQLLGEVELYLPRSAKTSEVQTFARLPSVPGIGPILALVLWSEIPDLAPFPRVQDFGSSCRVGKCAKEAGGKRLGPAGKKIGTVP